VSKLNVNKDRLRIRSAESSDAEDLLLWWNDGRVMAHAGFPFGLGLSLEDVKNQILLNEKQVSQLLILEYDDLRIGESAFKIVYNQAIIGIKICEFNYQNKGLGTKSLLMLIDYLFFEIDLGNQIGVDIIKLDTNIKNVRAQRVYEKLGFTKLRVNIDSWKNQQGELQSSIDYELKKMDYISST
jgi:RimJ/RimL family protein N-acetyltransferase